jgi:hypothetical protein
MTARELLEDLATRGATARVLPSGKLFVEPVKALDEALLASLKSQREEIIAELSRTAEPANAPRLKPNADKPEMIALTQHGVICRECRRLSRGYDPGDGFVCPECSEWRVAGCKAFTVLESADEAIEAQYGACLACGSSIELHGRPTPSEWRRVASTDDVELAAVRFVLAVAGEIVRGARADG